MHRSAARPTGPLTTLVALALLLTACTAGGEPTPSTVPPAGTAAGAVTFWHFFTGREAAAIEAVVGDFEQAFPDIDVEVHGGQDDEKMRTAIAAGEDLDVGLSFSTDIVGNFCSSGAFIDLGPFIERDRVDLGQLPEVVRSYTEFEGTRCAMPVLADAYGLYYNQRLLAAGGYRQPPRTVTELADMAKKLTKRAPDGTIEVAGFVPTFGFYENSAAHWAPHWGATWQDADGGSAVGSDPAWKDMLTWQKELVDWYGADNLARFVAGLGQEFSADNAFHEGKVAMMIDGEYRNAFLADQAPDLDYGTAPFPVADGLTDRYGAGYITGNVIGIGKGSDNPNAAWELVKYLTTDTGAIVELANGIKNIPSTTAALASPDLEVDPNFKTFLDIFAHPASATTPPSPDGGAYQETMGNFVTRWQAGEVGDLAAGLTEVAGQIDAARKLSGD